MEKRVVGSGKQGNKEKGEGGTKMMAKRGREIQGDEGRIYNKVCERKKKEESEKWEQIARKVRTESQVWDLINKKRKGKKGDQ